jgi:ATP-dependent DNA helicase RecQ
LRGVETASIVLVISPLISIITDQVASFCAKGIAAAFVGDKSAVSGIKCGKYQVVFLSPESLFCSFEWRQMLCTDVYISNLVGVIVDEAHCIKKW